MLNDHNDWSNQYIDIFNSRHKKNCEIVTLINDDITTLLNIHMYDLSVICLCPHSTPSKLLFFFEVRNCVSV